MNIYNSYSITPNVAIMQRMDRLRENERPANCIACGACTQHCPQSIDIPGIMAKLAEVMRTRS